MLYILFSSLSAQPLHHHIISPCLCGGASKACWILSSRLARSTRMDRPIGRLAAGNAIVEWAWANTELGRIRVAAAAAGLFFSFRLIAFRNFPSRCRCMESWRLTYSGIMTGFNRHWASEQVKCLPRLGISRCRSDLVSHRQGAREGFCRERRLHNWIGCTLKSTLLLGQKGQKVT